MSSKKEKSTVFVDKDVNGDKLEVTPEATREAVKDYYLNSVAKHVNNFLDGTTTEVEEKLTTMQKELTVIIDKKIDTMAEKIVEEVLSHRIKEEVEKKVAEKLKALEKVKA